MKKLFTLSLTLTLLLFVGCRADTQPIMEYQSTALIENVAENPPEEAMFYEKPAYVYEETQPEPDDEPLIEGDEPTIEELAFVQCDRRCFNPDAHLDNLPPEDLPICINLAAQFFTELCALFTQDGGYLWGQSLHTPYIFLCPDTRYIVANQPDSLGILHQVGSVFVGKLPSDFPAAYSFPTIGDRQWAMVSWDFVPQETTIDEIARKRMMVHMSFHVQQDQLFGRDAGWDNAHMNRKENRISIQLEINALLRAMESTGDERVNAAHDALAIRAARRDTRFLAHTTSEDALEFNEGLANYTEVIISGISMEDNLVWLRNSAETIRYQQSLAGAFGYTTGEMYGHLLDYTGIDWRTGLRRRMDLGELLQNALGIETLRTIDEVDLTLYGYEEIVAFETERTEAHAQLLEDIRIAFTTETTLHIPPGFLSGNLTLNPTRIHDLPGLGMAHGANVVVSEPFGDLRTYDGFFMRNIDSATGQFSGTVVATGIQKDGNTVTAPGWVLHLNDGYGVRYENGHYVLFREG